MWLANVELYIFVKFNYISWIKYMKDSVSFLAIRKKTPS